MAASTSTFGSIATRIDAATPQHRDRVMDLVRVASMLAVALGHWVMAVVWVDGDGSVQSSSLLVTAPWTQVVTLVLQVMGLFFAVGGWASARSLKDPPASTATWIHRRLRRLLAPVTLYVGVVAVVVPTVARLLDEGVAAVAQRAFSIHLWFVAVIVPLYVLTPWLLRMWRRLGPPVLLGLVAGAVAVDVAHRGLDLPYVGWLNF